MHIQYAFHRHEDCLVSRRGDQLAWPILDYEKIGQDGDYSKPLEYSLEKIPVLSVGQEWRWLAWTRYVPTELKNIHRKFWGLKPLLELPPPQTLSELLQQHKARFYYRSYAAKDDGPVAILHKPWGNEPGLYHWFEQTDRGYVFIGIADEVPGTKKVDRLATTRVS